MNKKNKKWVWNRTKELYNALNSRAIYACGAHLTFCHDFRPQFPCHSIIISAGWRLCGGNEQEVGAINRPAAKPRRQLSLPSRVMCPIIFVMSFSAIRLLRLNCCGPGQTIWCNCVDQMTIRVCFCCGRWRLLLEFWLTAFTLWLKKFHFMFTDDVDINRLS